MDDADGMHGLEAREDLLEDDLDLAHVERANVLDDAVQVGEHALHDYVQLVLALVERQPAQAHHVRVLLAQAHDGDLAQRVPRLPLVTEDWLDSLDCHSFL